ncbi:PaaX family transcriptional regulator [Streptomyces antnestii]|uniref:PaaX family transcriptional regulator n=2 Tax=Streptomyces antnestii TaxID=2494256 RepID=A0A437PF51_9ACTN|nr:PaaX family transcriptional regulator [Streptomyces sp. San01]
MTMTETADSDVFDTGPDDAAEPEVPPDDLSGRARGPQRLLMMLLGDYWFDRPEALPSAALVALLAEFGVSEVGARAALSRQSRRGLLDVEKRGRRTYYRLSARSLGHFTDTGGRIAAFGADGAPRTWDGQWSLVAFSVPEQQRAVRHTLREQLRWLGYAPLYDGVWISPHAREEEVRDVLSELGVATATLFTGTPSALSPAAGDPLSAWDLDAQAAAFERFTRRWGVWRKRAEDGGVSPSEALRARTELITEWRVLMTHDPALPPQLLPPHWPLAAARAVFVAVYDALGPLAEFRVRQLIALHDAELAGLATHHTVADLAKL